MMLCQRCGAVSRYRAVLTADNMMQRCGKCGTPHSCAAGRQPEALGPLILPITASTARHSMWMPPQYAPIALGVYECHFHGGERLRLRWAGSAWSWCGKPVDVSGLMKWRGRWSDT